MENQVVIGSAQKFVSPKCSFLAHETASRRGVPKKTRNMAIFNSLNVRKKFVDIHGLKFARDGVIIDYTSIGHLDENRDVKLIYKENVGEELPSPFITYTDAKKVYTI